MELKELKITRLYAMIDTFIHSDKIITTNILSNVSIRYLRITYTIL